MNKLGVRINRKVP